MTRKTIGRNTGKSGRINVSGSELGQLGVELGDSIDVEVVNSAEVAHALIGNKDTDKFLIVTPA